MEQQTLSGLPVGNGRLHCGTGRMDGLHIATEGPANDLPVIKVKYHRQIYPATQDTQVRDGVPLVRRHPFLPVPLGLKLTGKDVFKDLKPVVRNRSRSYGRIYEIGVRSHIKISG
jgi:hypothetical protein